MTAPTLTFHVGDALGVLRTLETASVDLVLSSSPFLALRSYLPADHPDKPLEGGSQATPGEFIDWLLDVVEECRRVLAPHGSLCIELGDTYAGSGGAGGDYAEGGMRDGQERFDGSASKAYGTGAAPRPARVRRQMGNGRDWPRSESAWRGDRDGWPLDKSLTLIPESFRFALAYGVNPHTGRETPRWRIRNVVRWVRPNPPVGALADKFRPGTSEMVVACTRRDRYFDLDSCRSLPARTTGGTELGAAAVTREHRGALHTRNGSYVARWWCDLRFTEIAVNGAMAGNAEREQVVELVGLDVRVETSEGLYMVDLEAGCGSASLASVVVAVQGCLPSLLPVGAAIVDPAPAVRGAVLTSPEGRAPLPVAGEAAEVVSLEGALIASDRLAARLTLKINGTLAYAWLIAPITRTTHTLDSSGSGVSTGAPPLDWWQIPTAPYKGSHYATWPPNLCIRPILAMTPPRVCLTCGKPSQRISERESGGMDAHSNKKTGATTTTTTTGWSDCGHDTWRPGVVLDPFAGTGTTGMVAHGHGRSAIGIDLDPRNVELARQRLGPLTPLTVIRHDVTAEVSR